MLTALERGERPSLTRSEKWLRRIAWVLVISACFFAAMYVYEGVIRESEFPYVVNSVAKDFLIAALAWLLARDVRRYAGQMVPVLVAVHLVMPLMLITTAIRGRDQIANTVSNEYLVRHPEVFRLIWVGFDILIVGLLLGFSFFAVRSRYALQYLWPSGYRSLIALAEVLVLRKDPHMAPAEIGHRVDAYLASVKAVEKWKVRASLQLLAFWPLLTLHPPFHLMSKEPRQRWVQRRFLDQTRDWFTPRFVRDLRRAMIRTAQQLSFMGYYSDPRAAADAHYIPFSQREKPALIQVKPRRRGGVHCLEPIDIASGVIDADMVIVGSGAAGSMLAYKLAERGRRVLVLERGSHVDPRSFTENEADQLAKLYRDGALTLTKDFRFQVLQGMCVGGSTVVNNAICLKPPAPILERWNDAFEAGLDLHRLDAAFNDVRRFLKLAPIGPRPLRNPGAELIAERIAAMSNGKRPMKLSLFDCNINNCRGCGYCNLGCKYGAKLSALDYTLPEAQRKFGERVRILPDCLVEKVVMRDGRAWGVRAQLETGRALMIQARQGVVLSAGALASSIILQRSGLDRGRAGRSVSFNVASPVTFDFDRILHSERGVQMTHYHELDGVKRPPVLFETWFNPIVTQSLFMPGWFERHWDNMRRYRNMTCLGVVVGSESNGRVKPGWTRAGVNLDYDLTDDDFLRMKDGVKRACRLGLDLKARRVMPATFHGLEIHSIHELERIETAIGDSSELLVNSSHPQGGNPISKNAAKGVVDEHFRVYGAPGLFVCDASVFPSSITFNPQMTVMALAVYAADEIAGLTGN